MSTVPKPPVDWELVFKRNPVERIKRDKAPLGIRDELPSLIAAGYENVAEEDIVRLQWWGLYHDKPKIGTFMLRVKVPAGQLPATRCARSARCRTATAAATASSRPDRTSSCTGSSWHVCPSLRRPRPCRDHHGGRLRRHGPQYHRLPGAGPRRRRALRRDPASPPRPTSSTATPTGRTSAEHKYSISACADRCNAPGDQPRLSLDRHDPRGPGRGSRCSSAAGSLPCRGSHASSVSSCRAEEANESSARSPDVWSEDHPLPRLPRQGAAEVHGRRDRGRRACSSGSRPRLGRAPAAATELAPVEGRAACAHHLGVHAQQPARASPYIGVAGSPRPDLRRPD